MAKTLSIPGIYDNGTELRVPVETQKTDAATELLPSNDPRTPQEMHEIPSNIHRNFVDLNRLIETGIVSYSSDISAGESDYATIKADLDGPKYLSGGIDLNTNEVYINKSQFDFTDDLELGGDTQNYSGFTVGYNPKHNRWISFYSFQPEMYANVGYTLLSFENARLWRHYANELYNNFYGIQSSSFFKVNFNASPSKIKIYDALSMEGSSPNWSVQLDTELNSVDFNELFWTTKEGIHRTFIPRTESESSFSNIIGLGAIQDISGNTLTIEGMDIYNLNLTTGVSVYENEVFVGTIMSIDTGNTITLTNVAGLVVGDFIYVKKNATIEGDRLRGYHAAATFRTVSEGEYEELYAVNAEVVDSKLHNT